MSISSPTQIQPISISPKELLDRFKKGERPVVENRQDKMTNELEALSEQYKQSMSVDVKRNILDKEREMLFEELKQPELTLARNYAQIAYASALDKDVKLEEFDDVLRLMNVTALQRESGLDDNLFNSKLTEKNIDTLKEVYLDASEKNNVGLKVKSFITELLGTYKESQPELSDKITDTLNYLYENTKHQDLKDNIKALNDEQTVDYCLDKLSKNEDYEYFLDQVMIKSDRKDSRVNELVSGLLKNEDTPNNIKRRAILGAGKFRSDENFEIIKQIALNINEPDIRKREFAIQSCALYLKDKPDEVTEIMSTVSKEDSIFAPLGRILSDKIKGNYYGQVDRELKYASFGPNRTKDFKYHFKKFYVSDDNLSQRKINSLHENTMPFTNYLKKLSRGRKYLIIRSDDTITRHIPDYIGQRYIMPHAMLNAGPFFDSYDGLNIPEYSIMSANRVADKNHQNQVAHETGHSIHDMLSDENCDIIDNLYEKAQKEGRIMDYYADANSHEYFAQGCDAFASHYKPHKLLLRDDPLGHTIYELMDKDPELYKFIKKVLKK